MNDTVVAFIVRPIYCRSKVVALLRKIKIIFPYSIDHYFCQCHLIHAFMPYINDTMSKKMIDRDFCFIIIVFVLKFSYKSCNNKVTAFYVKKTKFSAIS